MGGPYQETGFGVDIDLSAYQSSLTAVDLLFSESHGRVVVTCAPGRAAALVALAQDVGVPAFRAGTVGERGGVVRIRLRDAVVEHPVGRLREVYFTALPRRMGD
jgi:phosphoribosylformylglycinamidine (FGAM) synthase-like enzyme